MPSSPQAVTFTQPSKKPPNRFQRLGGSGALRPKWLKAPQRLRHPRAKRNPFLLPLVTTQKSGALSPLASLCLSVVRGWLRVVQRGRGGELRNGVPFTRLKASELQQQLEAEYQVAVSTKTVQRALTQLVSGGHLSRRQLYKHRYNRTYWYAPGELEQQAEAHRPRSVAARFNRTGSASSSQSSRPTQQGLTERSPVSLQALQAQLPSSTQKTASSQTPKQPQTGEAPCDPPEPRQEAVSRAWGHRAVRASKPATGAHSGRLEQAAAKLQAALKQSKHLQNLAGGLGFGPVEAQKPLAVRAQSAQAAGFLR